MPVMICMSGMASSMTTNLLQSLHEDARALTLKSCLQNPLFAAIIVAIFVTWSILTRRLGNAKTQKRPPAIPGIPILGNLLQLGKKKPYRLLTAWSKLHGPIFTIQTGRDTLVVISSSNIAKEAMVTKYTSIATRKMSRALWTLTRQKTMVAMADYGDEYRMLKKIIVAHLLGPIPQKNNRELRERITHEMLDDLFAELKGTRGRINVRCCIEKALFSLSMYQALGRDPDAVFVKEWRRNVSRFELYHILVLDPLKSVIEVDWRDFFPAFKWVPNKAVEEKVNTVERRRTTVMRAIIEEQRELLKKGKEPSCYLDTLLASNLTEKQLEMATWEPIIESADTSLVTTEWAMYELARNPATQARLYQEIKAVVGEKIVTEDHLPKLEYLSAIVQETLRRYPPVPLLPPRHVDEDVQLGGYDIPKGWQILINIYGINYNPKVWPEPDVWDADRMWGTQGIDLGIQDHRILSFGTGKRMCAGILQVMYVVRMFIAVCIQHFEWSLPVGQNADDGEDTLFLTTHKLHPLIAIATPRVSHGINC